MLPSRIHPGNPTHLQPSLEAGALTHFPSVVHEQRSARSEVCGIVKFVSPAVQGAQEQISQPNYVHHLSLCSSFCGFCSCSCLPFRLKLPAAFTQPGASTLSDFCRKFRSKRELVLKRRLNSERMSLDPILLCNNGRKIHTM